MVPFIQTFFDTRTFLKHKGPPTKLFGTVKQKSPTKSWYRYYPNIFCFQNVSETQKGSPMMLFGEVWQKKSTKSGYLLSKIFSIPEHFWNTRLLLRIITVLWGKKDRQIVTPLLHKKILIPEPFWNAGGFAHIFFRRFGTKKLPAVKRDTHLLIPKFFPY